MILSCNFEELRALASGAEALLSPTIGDAPLPAGVRAAIEDLQPRLTGDLEVTSLDDQRGVRTAVAAITDSLHGRMNASVLDHHPAHEESVLLYFDYAHSLTVLDRVDRLGAEMNALEDLIKEQGLGIRD